MRRALDGALSGLAALLTVLIVGVPVWGAARALDAALLPAWAWMPVILLGACGALIALSFGRKAKRGVHPLRERRR